MCPGAVNAARMGCEAAGHIAHVWPGNARLTGKRQRAFERKFRPVRLAERQAAVDQAGQTYIADPGRGGLRAQYFEGLTKALQRLFTTSHRQVRLGERPQTNQAVCAAQQVRERRIEHRYRLKRSLTRHQVQYCPTRGRPGAYRSGFDIRGSVGDP